MRLWAENVPGFSALIWNVDMPNLRYRFALDIGLGNDCSFIIEVIRRAPRTSSGSLDPQPPTIIEGQAVEELQTFSLQLVEAARMTYHPSMAKHKRPST